MVEKIWFSLARKCEMISQMIKKERLICRQNCSINAGNWRSYEREKNEYKTHEVVR